MYKKATLDPRIVKLEEQLKSLDDQFKRVLADYQNQEKRHLNQRTQIIKLANESLLQKLLPIIDDLERAQAHLKDQGLGHILKSFQTVLIEEGITVFDPLNQPFDPNTMDCAEVVAGPKDQVVKTVIKGYLYQDKPLRPAKVEVGSGITN